MSVMKVKESKFGAPPGIYTGKFLGVQPMSTTDKPRLGRDGKPMEPGLEWQFEVQGGEFAGQVVGRITSLVPTTKNACGVLLGGLVGRPVRPEDEIDPEQYRGQIFQVVVSPQKENPDKTYVTQIVRQNSNGAAPAAAAPPPRTNHAPAAATQPPPRLAPKPAPLPGPGTQPSPLAADGNERFWCQFGQEVEERTRTQLIDWLAQHKDVPPTALPCMLVGESEWRTAADYKLGDIPF